MTKSKKSKIREIISERFQKNETDSGIQWKCAQGLLKELRTKVTESDLGEDDAGEEAVGLQAAGAHHHHHHHPPPLPT